MFGYRTNLLVADGDGYVTASQLRRQLAAVAGDIRLTEHTVIEGNYSYYNLFQHGYPGWFAYSPTTTPLSTPGSKSILLPPDAPDPTREGYGQSFSGVDLTSQIGEVRVKHDFSSNWHLVVGVLNQLSDRNINTAVNQFLDNSGNYKSYLANSFSSLAPRFHVDSDLAYLTGRFQTGRIRHDVVIGSTGYRFASYSPVTNPAKTALCTANGICQANISDPLVDVVPPGGLFSYAKTSPSTGIYGSSIIRQQGFSFGDTITLTSALARATGREPGLDVDRQLHRQRGHQLSENEHSRRLCQAGSQPVRQRDVQAARGHDDLRHLCRQHSGAGCRGGEQRQHHHRQCQPGAAAVSQQGGRNRLQAAGAQDQLLHRRCSAWNGRLRILLPAW